jgi:hypothetical protein
MLAEARQEADATVRRGRQVADQAIADSERRVDALRAEIAQLEQQRDRVLDALGSLRDRLTHVAQDLVTSSHGDERPARESNVVSLPKAEERREPAPAPQPAETSARSGAEGEPEWREQGGERHAENDEHDEHGEHGDYEHPRAEGHWQH